MPRRTPPGRLTDIARAACKVFTEKGYRRTLMTDVGRELGLSHASLYRHVESKEALFQIALLYAIDPAGIDRLATPVPTPAPGEALEPIARWTGADAGTPVLSAALSDDHCADIRREFTDVVDELYSLVEDHRTLLALIESSAVDLPALHSLYFGRARRGQVGDLERYITRRTRSGLLRPVPDPAVATQFMVESVAWFAWHRRDHPDAPQVVDEEARKSVLALLAAAFVPDAVPDSPGSRSTVTSVDTPRSDDVVVPHQPAPAGEGVAPVDRRILVVAGALFVVLMALSDRYGFHRDELYFLDCARHLSGGYVDQPAFTPLLARVSLWVFGVSLPGLRLWPALAGAGTVVVAGMLARELGGSRTAQLLAGVGAATMPALIGADHLFGPTAFDLFFWAALALLFVRVGRTGDLRLWVPVGIVLGLGLANKHDIGFFAVALVLGLLASGGVRLLVSRWFVAGALIAGLFALPDLWWQALHHWPTVAMTRSLNQQNGGAHNVATWIVGQLFMVTLALVWVWVVGVRFLWRSDRPSWRALVWAYALLFVLFAATTGGKVYYLAGAYIYLLAAGAVRLEGWLDARASRRRLYAVTALSAALSLPLVLPILPVQDIGWTYGANPQLGETVGWPQLVTFVHSVWRSLPAAERSHAVIFTADYGEAGAINELGRGTGLPGAVSGHNGEWFWGPGDPDATTVVAVAPGPVDVTGYGSYLRRFFRSVRVAATLSNRAGLHNQEWGGHIYLCTGLRRPWGRTWASLRHYS